MATIMDMYPDVKLKKCGEGGCGVKLEKSFAVYCGEKLRDLIMEKNKSTQKMFDCVIADSSESKISAVELKNRFCRKLGGWRFLPFFRHTTTTIDGSVTQSANICPALDMDGAARRGVA